MKHYFVLVLLWLVGSVKAQLLPLIPYPAYVKTSPGSFVFNRFTAYRFEAAHPSLQLAVNALTDRLRSDYRLNLQKAKEDQQSNYINFDLDSNIVNPEGYEIIVSASMVNIKAKTPAGAFYAVTTLLQLLPLSFDGKPPSYLELPLLTIQDQPYLSYRGLMLDVSRHFMPLSFLYKLVDLMSFQKMNNLHLHLTDDQGWRMEIKKYPLLTTIGSKRSGTVLPKNKAEGNDNKVHEGFYKQDELKAFVAYASAHFVNVIPEIEMPGHASAAIAAYPQLSCFPEEATILDNGQYSGVASLAVRTQHSKIVQENWGVFQDVLCPSEYTIGFMKDVLDEVMEVFPSPYLHIGGDECPKENWKRSPYCQKLMMDSGIADEKALQSYFIGKISTHLKMKGRTLMGWDEILEGGLPPDALVMSWRGESGGIEAARQKHPVIMTPYEFCYFNTGQSTDPADTVPANGYLSLEKVYSYQPVPRELNPEQRSYVKGLQGCLWTEQVPFSSKAEYQLFPRAIALAEVGWCERKQRFDHFIDRLFLFLDRMNLAGVHFSHNLFDIKLKSQYDTATKSLMVSQQGVHDETLLYYAPDTANLLVRGLPYEHPVALKKDQRMSIGVIIGEEVVDRAVGSFTLNKATGLPIQLEQLPAKQYAKGGVEALTNGLLANENRFTDPEWLGWNGKDFSAVLQWPTKEKFKSLTFRFYNDPQGWVHLPEKVTVLASDDGVRYREVASRNIDASKLPGVQPIFLNLNNLEAKYLKLQAINRGEIPAGLPGEGSPSWLFVDELILR